MNAEERATVDRAAAIRTESRAEYIRRVALRDARAELRRLEREAASQAAPAA